jgi:transcription antitermination factor NusG
MADVPLGATRAWFAVQVWTGREQLSATHLGMRGYEVFLPCYCEQRRWSDRIKHVQRALFAGYVFCQASTDVVATIVAAPGVIRIVGDRHRPLPVPDVEIDALKRIVQTSLPRQPWPLATGQPVRVEAGPLRGLEGVVVARKNEHRLVVSIQLLQRAVAVEIAPEWVTASAPILFEHRVDQPA